MYAHLQVWADGALSMIEPLTIEEALTLLRCGSPDLSQAIDAFSHSLKTQPYVKLLNNRTKPTLGVLAGLIEALKDLGFGSMSAGGRWVTFKSGEKAKAPPE